MKKLLFILLAAPCIAAGPKYNFKDVQLNDELQNVYHDITNASSKRGINSNKDANSGEIGEYISSTVGNTAAPTSTQWGDITSITLTPGDWDVSLSVATNSVGSVITAKSFGIGIVSGNNTPGATQMLDFISEETTANQKIPLFMRKRFLISTTTIVYAKMNYTWAGGTVYGLCSLQARRIR